MPKRRLDKWYKVVLPEIELKEMAPFPEILEVAKMVRTALIIMAEAKEAAIEALVTTKAEKEALQQRQAERVEQQLLLRKIGAKEWGL